jgi:ATP-dependent protease ClpP protease subunit
MTTNNADFIRDIHEYNLDLSNRHIFLHNYISADDNPGVDYRMANNFIKNIRILDSISQLPILIHMHSVGGNWGDGMAIYDAVLSCRSYVTILAYGQAESMSSIIFQAADKKIMTPNSYFMLHYGSSGYEGNYLDVQNAAEFEKRVTENMMNIYLYSFLNSKFYKEKLKPSTPQKARSFLEKKLKDGDWFLSVEEAIYYGFADGVLTSKNYKYIDSL